MANQEENSMMQVFTMMWFVICERLLCWLPHPRLRAIALRAIGADVGYGVRVHSCRFINHERGFASLSIGDGVYIGADCLLDLAGILRIDERATVSARCILMTHTDPGSSHGNVLAKIYPPSRLGCHIGADTWLGVGVTVLECGDVGAKTVVGAASVVTGSLPPATVCVGQPASVRRRLD
jgi:acetyltransferase-like isoleucine patch superfamily enzyme